MDAVYDPAYTLKPGTSPVLISMPHNASRIPPELLVRMQPYAQTSPDTDWFVDRLYDFAPDLGIGVLAPVWSRYVVDLNRPPDDQNLYPGSDTTGLCPIDCFDQRPIYMPGQEPDAAEIGQRVDSYWRPYHRALEAEIARLHTHFGLVIVYEAHSIASVVPRFFDGPLPDLNLGSNSGASCAESMQDSLVKVAAASGFSWVLNGRFRGGHITRAYARPQTGVHTFQLELSQATYLDEADRSWMPQRAATIQAVLQELLASLLAWSRDQSGSLAGSTAPGAG